MLEKVITGIVLSVIVLAVLAAYLPLIAPYAIVIVLVVSVARLVWFYTGRF